MLLEPWRKDEIFKGLRACDPINSDEAVVYLNEDLLVQTPKTPEGKIRKKLFESPSTWEGEGTVSSASTS